MTVFVLMPEPARLHSGYHAELTAHPPEDVKYNLTDKVLYCPVEVLSGTSPRLSLYANERNPHAYDAFDNIPFFLPPFVEQADLIHSHMYPVLNDKPFVIDMGHVLFPWMVPACEWSRMTRLEIPCVPRDVDMDRLQRLAVHLAKPNCRRILAWSPHVQQTIIRLIADRDVQRKVELLYPAVHPRKVAAKSEGPVRIMFCGSAGAAKSFIRKGGDDVFRMFDRLRESFDVELCYVGYVPSALRAKYSDRQEVEIHDRLSKEDLFAQYERSHIFVLPSRLDTFGMVCLEAMNHELPIVATVGEQFRSNDVVDDGKGGFLVPMVTRDIGEGFTNAVLEEIATLPETPSIDLDQALDHLAKLIERPELRREMGRYNKRQILEGKYSISRRNQRLAEIYAESLA